MARPFSPLCLGELGAHSQQAPLAALAHLRAVDQSHREMLAAALNRAFMKQHPYGRDAPAFRDALDVWLDKHRQESAALLHEVGLLPEESYAYSGLIC